MIGSQEDDRWRHNACHIDIILVDCDVSFKKKKLKILRFYCREVESTRNSKLWRLSGRFQTLSWRPGDTVLNLESPGLSGRVDSPVFYSSVASWVLFFSSAASLFPLVIIYGVLQPSSEFLGISHLDKAPFGMWHKQNQTAVIRRYKSRQIWKLSNVFYFCFDEHARLIRLTTDLPIRAPISPH